MIAPNAGELIQELILANTLGLSISSIFNKIYPYPVATRINQQLIIKHKPVNNAGTTNDFFFFALLIVQLRQRKNNGMAPI